MLRRSAFFFIALNLLLSSFYLDTWNNGNSASRMLSVYYAVNEGTFCIDKQHHLTSDKSFINGHYYSDKAPLPAFITIPFYKFIRMCGYPADDGGKAVYILGTLLCAVIPFVIILWLIYREAQKKSSLFSPALLAMLPLYGSFIFIYAGTFYNHMLSALLLLLAYIFIRNKKFLYAGLLAGLAFLSEYIIANVIAGWALQVWFNEKKSAPVLKFGLGVVPSVAVIMVYNYIFTGGPFTMLYKFHSYEALHSDYGFSHPTFASLWGLTFSQYKGLFFYVPFLLIPLYFFLRSCMKGNVGGKSLFGSYVLYCAVLSLLLVSSYFGWWGGWAYGPRLILFAAVLLIFEGVTYIQDKKVKPIVVWGLCACGLVITLTAKFTVLYSVPSDVYYPFTDLVRNNILAGNFNPGNLLTMWFGVSPLAAAITWSLVFVAAITFLLKFEKRPSNVES